MKRSSIQNSRLNVKPIPYNFGVNLNIPIDPRFIISSLDNIDTEIPLNLRYNGLIFFVVDATVNDGTVETLEGLLYTFEKDLTKPIPLYDTIIRFIIHQIEISSRDYSNIDVLLKSKRFDISPSDSTGNNKYNSCSTFCRILNLSDTINPLSLIVESI